MAGQEKHFLKANLVWRPLDGQRRRMEIFLGVTPEGSGRFSFASMQSSNNDTRSSMLW